MVWDIVKEEEFQRTKEVTLPSPSETLVSENSTKEGELLVYQEPKTTVNISNADVFTYQQPKTPETMGSNEKECPPAPKKPKKPQEFYLSFGNDSIFQNCEKLNLVRAIRTCSLFLICRNFRLELPLFLFKFVC